MAPPPDPFHLGYDITLGEMAALAIGGAFIVIGAGVLLYALVCAALRLLGFA